MNLLKPLQGFLFAPVSARGFGLMRMAWAGTALWYFLMQWKDVTEFYSSAGLFPRSIEMLTVRSMYRFTILDYITDPHAVFGLYVLLLLALFASCIGLLPRLSTILSFVLMISFHERNPWILGGGDTVLRNVGFLLCIAPTLRAFSYDRLVDQWKEWKAHRQLLPDLQMSIWPYRLLLWQTIVLYISSVWYKLIGTMWIGGTAVTAALQHEIFARWPQSIMRFFLPTAPIVTYLTLVFESCWALLLWPRSLSQRMLGVQFQLRLKRWLILIGVCFHVGICILMDVGSFSTAMLVMYLGLLTEEDFEAIKNALNKNSKFQAPNSKHGGIHVLYDGHCGLCLRSVFWLQLIDWLGRLSLVDFRDKAAKDAVAPDLSEEALDKALHILLPDGRSLHGFDALRAIAWHLPLLVPVAPLLYLPGIPPIGRRVYAQIAARRKRCTHEGCNL